MEQGFFFDGIHMTGNGFAIDQSQQRAGSVLSNGADPPTAFFDDTSMAAQIAFDLFVF